MLRRFRGFLRPALIAISLICVMSVALRAEKLGTLFIKAATTSQELADSVKDLHSRAGDFSVSTDEGSSKYMLSLLDRRALPNGKPSLVGTLSVKEGNEWKALCSIDNGSGRLQNTWAMAARGIIDAAEKCVREPGTRQLLPLAPAATPPVTAQAVSVAPKPDKLTNESVKELAQAGLGDEIVVAKIRNASEVAFDLSTDALLNLKKANVSGSVIAAMIDRDAKQGAQAQAVAAPPVAATPQAPCSGIELMGLFKNEVFDRSMGGGVVEWLAKIRNNTNQTKIVIFTWLDEYGQPKRGQVQIGGGQIASPRVDLSQSKFIAPVKNLVIVSCQ